MSKVLAALKPLSLSTLREVRRPERSIMMLVVVVVVVVIVKIEECKKDVRSDGISMVELIDQPGVGCLVHSF